ncbi:MAG: ATP-binding protein [Tissierellia bacterium]|nr:ATP-binding protein [Tissierellia bacterium]
MIYNEAIGEINQLRNDRIRDFQEKQNKLYADIPRIKEIDWEISDISTRTAVELLFSGEEGAGERAREAIKSLRAERDAIMKERGIPLDFLQVDYGCKKCEDKGFLQDGSRCDCLKDLIRKKQYERSGLKDILERDNFDTFNLKLFSDKLSEGEVRSPRENMEEIKEIAQKFSKNVNGFKKNLFFYGETGLGKTFLSSCIVKEAIDNGYSVVYETIFRILETSEALKFNKPIRNPIDYQALFEADLLVIDDLGTETANSFTNSELFNIINSRIMSGKKMVISSNLEPSMISSKYSERISSRLISDFLLLKFYGKDLRRTL